MPYKVVTTRTNMAAMYYALQSSNYKDKHGSYVTMPYKVVTTRTNMAAMLLCLTK